MTARILFVAILANIALLLITATPSAAANRAYVSWYGPGLYGNPQACGGRLQTWTVGVAHRWLPCGSRVTICYRRCGTFRVIDRGPFIAGRTFDLTRPARDQIGMAGGVVLVRWWRV